VVQPIQQQSSVLQVTMHLIINSHYSFIIKHGSYGVFMCILHLWLYTFISLKPNYLLNVQLFPVTVSSYETCSEVSPLDILEVTQLSLVLFTYCIQSL